MASIDKKHVMVDREVDNGELTDSELMEVVGGRGARRSGFNIGMPASVSRPEAGQGLQIFDWYGED